MRRATRPAALLLSLAALLALPACGGSANPTERADTAQAALSKGDFATARATAKTALAGEGVAADKALSWKLERIQLEAAAGEGDGAAVLAGLERLAKDYAAQVTAELYAKLGNRLAESSKLQAAIDVVEAGKARFEQQGDAFDALIASITAKAKAAGDSATLESLKSLGYL